MKRLLILVILTSSSIAVAVAKHDPLNVLHSSMTKNKNFCALFQYYYTSNNDNIKPNIMYDIGCSVFDFVFHNSMHTTHAYMTKKKKRKTEAQIY